MGKQTNKQIKSMLNRYSKASKEIKGCENPCLKNSKSDKYCKKCADEIIGDLFSEFKTN